MHFNRDQFESTSSTAKGREDDGDDGIDGDYGAAIYDTHTFAG